MKILSAFRTKRDFCGLREGEVFNLSLFTGICDLDTSVSRKVLYELYCAAIGEDAAFDTNYADVTDGWRAGIGSIDGVLWIDMMKSDSPQLIINGPITRTAAGWCSELVGAVNKNDRVRMADLFLDTDITHRIVVFVNGPGVGCFTKIHFEACSQFITSSVDPNHYYWSDGYYIIPGFHSVVSRSFLNRLKEFNKLRKPFSGRLEGYIAKLTLTGKNPSLKGFGSTPGKWEFYLAGNGYWVINPGCAFIYSSATEASKAADAAKPDPIYDPNKPRNTCVRELLGTAANPFSIYRGNTMDVSIIGSKQWRSEMFGMSDGINYYAEAVKEEV